VPAFCYRTGRKFTLRHLLSASFQPVPVVHFLEGRSLSRRSTGRVECLAASQLGVRQGYMTVLSQRYTGSKICHAGSVASGIRNKAAIPCLQSGAM
jgi:hypothetical protein